MEGQVGTCRGPEAECAGQQYVGTEQCLGGWQAYLQLSVDSEGRLMPGHGKREQLVGCSRWGEAAVARDLAAHWLRCLTGSRRKQNAPTACYEQHCPALLQQLGSIKTLAQLRAQLEELRKDRTLASTAAALGLRLASEQAPAPVPAAGARAAFLGVRSSGDSSFSAGLMLRLDAKGRPQHNARDERQCVFEGSSAPEAAVAFDLAGIWRKQHINHKGYNNTQHNYSTNRWATPCIHAGNISCTCLQRAISVQCYTVPLPGIRSSCPSCAALPTSSSCGRC